MRAEASKGKIERKEKGSILPAFTHKIRSAQFSKISG